MRDRPARQGTAGRAGWGPGRGQWPSAGPGPGRAECASGP